jgi:hypothetical protein
MKIAFYSPHMGLRGTEVTLFDFAKYNEEILGNTSVIIYTDKNPNNDQTVIEKFKNRFGDNLFSLKGPDYDFGWNAGVVVPLIDKILVEQKCDGLFMQKFGHNDGVVSKVCKTFVMCASSLCEPHGTVYSYVSEWLSKKASGGKYPYVPSIVDLPSIEGNFRKSLGIPDDALVFGRTGGMDTWNLPWASEVVKNVVQENSHIYFLFQNTPHFYMHRNIRHVPNTADMEFKVKFINTCDAMIHARYEGESFGVACGEFSLRNKPVITWYGSPDRHHIEVLGDKGFYYNTPQELKNTLVAFVKQPEKDWNTYRQFNPESVMKKFEKVYLT